MIQAPQEPHTKSQFLWHMLEINNATGVHAVGGLVDEPHWITRADAYFILGHIGHHDLGYSVLVLRERLDHEHHPIARRDLVNALERLGVTA